MNGTTLAQTLVSAFALASLFLAPTAVAQTSGNDATLLFPLVEMPDGSLTAKSELLHWLDGRERVVLVENQVPGALDLAFELERVAVPGSHGTLFVDGRPSGTIRDACSPDFSVWKGRVADQPASDVFLAFSSAGTWGWVRLEDGRTIHLVCGSHPQLGWERAQARWVEDAAMLRPGFEDRFRCGVLNPDGTPYDGSVQLDGSGERGGDNERGGDEQGGGSKSTNPPVGGAGSNQGGVGGNGGGSAMPLFAMAQQTIYVAEAVIETDYAYYQEFNNATAATNYANALIAACSDRYQTQAGCRWDMTYFALHTSNASDPFAGTNPNDLLDEIKAMWTGSSGLHVQGDFGLVLSGHGGGGVAYIGTLCSNNSAVGSCCSINGNTNFPVTGTSSLNWDFIVTTHESGHIFNSPHTHSFCPPLDLCDTNCNGTVQCSLGTIMSYCHTCSFQGVKNLTPFFHQTVADRIRTKVLAVNCLTVYNPTPPAPIITNVSPSTVLAITPDAWPTITLTGQNFSSVDSVQVDGVFLTTLPAQYTIVSNTRIDIPWTPKSKLGGIQVRVGNGGGTVTANVVVVPNTTAVLDLVPSQPALWFQALGLKVYMAGPTENLLFLTASTSGLPTIIPGLVSLDLGNGLTNYIDLGIRTVDPVKGYTLFQSAPGATSFLSGTVVYIQAVIVSTLSPVAPFPVTTLQQVTVGF